MRRTQSLPSTRKKSAKDRLAKALKANLQRRKKAGKTARASA